MEGDGQHPDEGVDMDRVKEEVQIDRAVRLRGQILDASLVADEGKMAALLRDAKDLRVSDGVMRYSGIGMVFSDGNMWPQKLQQSVKALRAEWMTKVRVGRSDVLHGHASVKLDRKPSTPHGGLKFQAFVMVASELASAVQTADSETVELRTYKETGLVLAGKGFTRSVELHSFLPAEAKLFSRKLHVVSCLERCMTRWQVQRQMKKEARMKTLRLQELAVPVQEITLVCDGEALADEIEENAIGAGLQRHKDLSAQLGLPFYQGDAEAKCYDEQGKRGLQRQ